MNFDRKVPDGDDRPRRMCTTCGFIDYENPKIIVGSVVRHDNKILLCKRAIEPRKGYWTLPAGFLELGETVEQGAKREAREEAGADLRILSVLGIYSIPRIGQVQIMHLAELASPAFAAGPESEEVRLFAWEEIPWDALAFPSVHWSLNHARAVWDGAATAPLREPD